MKEGGHFQYTHLYRQWKYIERKVATLIDKYRREFRGRLEYAGPQNESIKLIVDLANNKVPNHRRLFTVQGLWALQKVIEFKLEVMTFIFCPELIHSPEAENMALRLFRTSPRTLAVSKKVYERFADRDNPDGLTIIGRLPQSSLHDIALRKENLVVVLDGLEIPGNVGTVIRSIDGAGGDGVILVNRKVRLNHPKVLKGSHGASLSVPIIEHDFDQVIAWLIDNKFTIYLTDTRAVQNYYQTDYSGRVAIVAGNEKHGISKKWYSIPHIPISIPMLGRCDSLNVGVATSIVVYEACIRRNGYSREAVGTSGVDSPHILRQKRLRQSLPYRKNIAKDISDKGETGRCSTAGITTGFKTG